MKRPLLLLLSLFVLLPLCSQNIYLLSVGICDYKGKKNDLRLPVTDAKTIAQVYKKCHGARVEQLLDSGATCRAIKNSMQSLFSSAGSDDIVIFFFSGHGTPDGFVAYDGVLSYKDIRTIFSKSKSLNKMVFADACYSGKLRATKQQAATGNQQNVMFFLSSRSNEKSIEMGNMKNGLFTAFLERGIRGGADNNRDRTITAKELFGFVGSGVKKLSKEKQHPVMWGNFNDNMPVIKW